MIQKRFSRRIALALCLCMFISCIPTMPAMAETAAEHTVTYQLDGSVYATQTVSDGGTIGERPADPSKDDFTFLYWYQEGANPVTAFDFGQPVTADLVLIACFEAIPDEPDETIYFTVTFEDGLTGAVIDEQTIEQGQNAVAPEPPTHDGYQFKEWDTDYTNVLTDITVTATYEALHQYSVTIRYYFADSTRVAASPYVAWLPRRR